MINARAEALARRIEEGAASLAAFARGLSDEQWKAVVPPDGRTVGVIVHHVASMYAIEVQLAQELVAGRAIEGVTWDAVADINAKHAQAHADVTRDEAVDALSRESRAAADAVRRLSDEQLDRAAAVSLNGDAPLTAQFPSRITPCATVGITSRRFAVRSRPWHRRASRQPGRRRRAR